MVAWPPQLTMFTLGAFACAPRLTTGTTYGTIAAGVRSMSFFPRPSSASAFFRWALADVASNTTRISSNSFIFRRPPIPWSVMATPIRFASANPADEGSTPTRAPISSDLDIRNTFIIRSVPILPDPIIATLCDILALVNGDSSARDRGDIHQAAHDHIPRQLVVNELDQELYSIGAVGRQSPEGRPSHQHALCSK